MLRKQTLLYFLLVCILQVSSICGYKTDVSLYTGLANIHSTDFVFAPKDSGLAHTVSKLNWTANDVWVLGAIGKVTLPENKIHILLDCWSKVNTTNGKMVDRDYLDEFDHSQLTDISIHPDTKLKTAFAIDLELGKGFSICRDTCSPWTFQYLLGVKYIRYDWQAFGGHCRYNNDANVGSFRKGLKVMTYSQQLTIPYIGLQANWSCSANWSLRAFGKYSPLGYAYCYDRHLLRSTTFTDEHYCAQYWILGAEAVWLYSEKIQGYLKYSYDQLGLTKGSIKMHEPSGRSLFRNASGVKSTLQMVTIGVTACY